MEKLSKRILLVMGLLLILGLLNAVRFVQDRQKPVQKLVIAYDSHPAAALLYVAEENGFFTEQNLEIDFRQVSPGQDPLESVLKGEADLAASDETSFVRKIMEGEEISALSALHASNLETRILAKVEKGISRPADLRGKSIGVAKGADAEFFLSTYLLSQGVGLEEVKLVDTDQAKFFEAFDNPDLDALVLRNPYLRALEKKQGSRVVSFQSDVYVETSLLAGKKGFLESRQDAMPRLLGALVKAEEFAGRNRQAAVTSSVNFLSRNRQAAVGEEDIAASWDSFEPTLRLSNVLLINLERQALWLKKNSLPQAEVPDFRRHLLTAPLKQVKAEFVTIF